MSRSRRRFAPRIRMGATAMAWLAVACSDPLQVEFLEVGRGSGEDRVQVTGQPDQVVIEGVISVPLSCFGLRGTSRRSGRDIELRVRAVPPEPAGPCVSISGTHAYRATFEGLPAGEYRYVVSHRGLFEGEFEGRVEVAP